MKSKCRGTKISKKSVYIDPSVTIGNNVIIHDNVTIKGFSRIEDGAEIFSGTEITESIVGSNTKIKSSFIEFSEIGENNIIGPFARIRKGTKTGQEVCIGSFVEVKNSFIQDFTKASHLCYIGDSTIGKRVNIGCGVVFCNYNGKAKQHSIVEDDVFIGGNCNIIAPVTIQKGAYICAGTTITKDVSADDFVIGRVRQEHKPNLAVKYLDKKNKA